MVLPNSEFYSSSASLPFTVATLQLDADTAGSASKVIAARSVGSVVTNSSITLPADVGGQACTIGVNYVLVITDLREQ